MIPRVLLVALAAGIVAGLAATGLQELRVTPLILEAEAYESGTAHGDTEATASHDHGEAGHDHAAAGAWTPENGLERRAYTLMSNVLTGIAFGLLLVAGYVLRGRRVDLRQGLLWGLAGFAVFNLAPALGLPPELPGSIAADLGERQLWWFGTVAATGLGLAAIVFAPRWPWKLAGAFLVVMPHAVGAPHPPVMGGAAPPELAAEFAVATVVVAALFWLVLGATSGYLFDRLERRAAT